jgi:UDP-GlcNAc:undecaprenyl-phosphate/decaprenyl-phosphate GlcNAc-1-phosphate transferase
MAWWHVYLVILFCSGVLALILTPVCQKLAVILDFMDRPQVQEHKKHSNATPLLGGVAIFLSWSITIGFGFFAPHLLDLKFISKDVANHIPGIFSVGRHVIFIGVGAFLAMLLGLYDDKYNMRAITKLAGQFGIAAIAVYWGGVKISFFFSNPIITFIISVLWIVVIINSVNFFDNMDGLAVGTAAICLCFFSISAAVNQQFFVAALGAAAAGASIGFWFFNHSPAAIFMGDSGSHFLGYILAVVSASVTYYQAGISTTKFPILIPLFILAIPLFDAMAVAVIRFHNKKPIYIGDHNHISHRFFRMGMSRKRAVFCVHMLVLMVGLSVLPLLWGDERTTVVSVVQAVTILIFTSFLQYSIVRKKSE